MEYYEQHADVVVGGIHQALEISVVLENCSVVVGYPAFVGISAGLVGISAAGAGNLSVDKLAAAAVGKSAVVVDKSEATEGRSVVGWGNSLVVAVGNAVADVDKIAVAPAEVGRPAADTDVSVDNPGLDGTQVAVDTGDSLAEAEVGLEASVAD